MKRDNSNQFSELKNQYSRRSSGQSNASTPSKSMSSNHHQQSSNSRPGSSRGSGMINRLRVESSDDGSGTGITIGGVFISANCNTILIIMASIFIVFGIILTAISYRPRELSEELDRFMSRQEWSAQVKIVGPIAMILGTIMLLIGLTFCCLGWKVSQDEQKRMNSISPNSTTISNIESQLMPTISNALLRHPSFPLIVPKAEWRTPQIIKNSSGTNNNASNIMPPHQNQEFQPSQSRPRAVSLQIPFMGGTIVPSNHMNLAKKFRIRRNSVPPSNVADERRNIAFAFNDVMKENESITTKVKRHFSRSKSADFICTDHAPPHEYCYWTVSSIPPVSRDIACFPISTSSVVVKCNFTDEMINRKKSVVSRLSENNDVVIDTVSRW